MHEALARQIIGQRPPRRPLAVEASHLDDVSRRCSGIAFGLRPRCILFQAGELKLKLLQDRTALRGLTELHVA